jgi:hypothetical protein
MSKDLDIPKGIKPEILADSSKEPEQMRKEESPTVGDSPPAKRRRGRPKRSDIFLSPTAPTDAVKHETGTTQDGSSATPASTILQMLTYILFQQLMLTNQSLVLRLNLPDLSLFWKDL